MEVRGRCFGWTWLAGAVAPSQGHVRSCLYRKAPCPGAWLLGLCRGPGPVHISPHPLRSGSPRWQPICGDIAPRLSTGSCQGAPYHTVFSWGFFARRRARKQPSSTAVHRPNTTDCHFPFFPFFEIGSALAPAAFVGLGTKVRVQDGGSCGFDGRGVPAAVPRAVHNALGV